MGVSNQPSGPSQMVILVVKVDCEHAPKSDKRANQTTYFCLAALQQEIIHALVHG